MFPLLCLTSCQQQTLNRTARRVQRTLAAEQQKAQQVSGELINALAVGSFDSIWSITQTHKDILVYVFDPQGMVFWSQNWLAGQQVRLDNYNQWYYQRFQNAHCVCRWVNAGQYNILTVIPVATAYSVSNEQLHNTFVKPFKGSDKVGVTTVRHERSRQITSLDGTVLFCLQLIDNQEEANVEKTTRLSESFSYQALLNNDTDKQKPKRSVSIYLYFALEVTLFVALIVLGVIGLVRARGWRNMRLQTRFQYVMLTLLLLMAVYIFAVSALHVRSTHEAQQRHSLEQKTKYIQKALQDMYFWNLTLSQKNTTGMSIDLRDLSFAYETDINVYDLKGMLVGTSAPMLFDKGLISSRIAPEPIFTGEAQMMQYENIGDMRYLSAYTEFYNGNYEQIGYINVPQYISAEALNKETNEFFRKLLLPNLIVIVLSFIVSFFMARSMTRPLSELANRMKDLRIGQKSNKLEYRNNDEVGELVERYNQMVEQLEHSTEMLAKTEREGAWRTMARQIAHEINNPLTPMKLTIQQLQRMKQTGDERFGEYFKRSTALLIEQIDTLSHIAQSFSLFAKIPEVTTAEVDIAQKLLSVITLFRNNQADAPIRYIGQEKGVMAVADENQISQVFNNLIRNALQAIEGKTDGDIIIMLSEHDNMVEISVSDNGCGIPQDIRDKVFRPNFTTKNTGMGLGLAVSKNIVEGCGGTIRFSSSESEGTTFVVSLSKVEN